VSRISDLAPEKGGEAKKQVPNKPTQKKSNSKQDGWRVIELFFGSWGQYTNSNCQTSLREELTKQLPLKDRGKKTLAKLPNNHLARIRQSLCLNTSTRTGCWMSNSRTTKPEILLFLNLESFCVVIWLFVCFVSCLFVCVCLSVSPCWVLWFYFLFVCFYFCFIFFVSFTIVS
jgi:hypothetical protein